LGYHKRVTKDLDRWIALGWVESAHRESILDDIGSGRPTWSAAGALAILGSVLLGMAAVSFVASNWAGLSPIVKLIAIAAALWGTLLGAGHALDRQHPAIGHALAILGTALFGLSIMLTAQTFNMSSFSNTAILIWAIAGLTISSSIPSRPVLILSAILGALWVAMETNNPFMPDIMWLYPVLWFVTAAIAFRLRSVVTFNLLGFALFAWINHALWAHHEAGQLSLLTGFCASILIAGAIAVLAALGRDKTFTGAGVLAGWASTLAVLGGYALQWPLAEFDRWQNRAAETVINTQPAINQDRWLELAGDTNGLYIGLTGAALSVIIVLSLVRNNSAFITRSAALAIISAAFIVAVLPFLVSASGAGAMLLIRIAIGAAIFATSIALILQGAHSGRRFIGGLGILTFIMQTMYVYTETFGDLLDTAIFFLIGGLLLFALSTVLLRLRAHVHKRVAPTPEESS
jgi:uncharacterized membrane protein